MKIERGGEPLFLKGGDRTNSGEAKPFGYVIGLAISFETKSGGEATGYIRHSAAKKDEDNGS